MAISDCFQSKAHAASETVSHERDADPLVGLRVRSRSNVAEKGAGRQIVSGFGSGFCRVPHRSVSGTSVANQTEGGWSAVARDF
jgi:hypothetical protein